MSGFLSGELEGCGNRLCLPGWGDPGSGGSLQEPGSDPRLILGCLWGGGAPWTALGHRCWQQPLWEACAAKWAPALAGTALEPSPGLRCQRLSQHELSAPVLSCPPLAGHHALGELALPTASPGASASPGGSSAPTCGCSRSILSAPRSARGGLALAASGPATVPCPTGATQLTAQRPALPFRESAAVSPP